MASLEVSIHQIVLLNIADHYTRNKIQQQQKDKTERVFGALIGILTGKQIQILGSFEGIGKVDHNDEITVIDMEFIQKKMNLLKEVYKTSELIGWYSMTNDMKPKSGDLKHNKKFLLFSENPVYLCFDPKKKMKNSYDLALKVYESKSTKEIGRVEEFTELPYEIEAEPTENICIEHLTKNISGTGSSLFADTLSTTVSSVKILSDKIQILIDYIEKNPEAAKNNPNFFREVKELCINFPSSEDPGCKKELVDEFNETTMINMLTSLLVANKTIQDVLHLKMGFDVRSMRSFLDA